MSYYGVWILSLVVTAHHEITTGLLDQWPPVLFPRAPNGRATKKKRRR